MEETVRFVLDQSIAEPTRRRYASAWKKYSDWCSQLGEAPLPITEDKAMAYVVTLTREGLRVGTVKYHLASIRMAQIKAGMAGPDQGRHGWPRLGSHGQADSAEEGIGTTGSRG